MNKIYTEPSPSEWEAITARPVMHLAALEEIVKPILQQVQNEGDVAVRKYALQFDGSVPPEFKIPETDINNAGELLSAELKEAIQLAQKNIYTFHRAQLQSVTKIETMPGVTCWRKPIALDAVGLYIPGGSAPLFSTLLMLAIPAQIAGCKNIML